MAAHGNATSPEATCARVRAHGRRRCRWSPTWPSRGRRRRSSRDAVEALGGLDILVNNAGIIRRAPAAETADEDWQAVIDVDLTALFRLARAAGRHMLASGRGGRIVNVASILSFQGGVRVPAYVAAKHGVAGLTKALANEWASSGVNVNAVAPGYMVTDNTEALRADPERSRQILERIPAGRWGEPGRPGGRGRLPGLPRRRVRSRPRAGGGRRLAGALTRGLRVDILWISGGNPGPAGGFHPAPPVHRLRISGGKPARAADGLCRSCGYAAHGRRTACGKPVPAL